MWSNKDILINEQRPLETYYSVITLHVESTIDFIVSDDDNHSPYALEGFHYLDYRLTAV